MRFLFRFLCRDFKRNMENKFGSFSLYALKEKSSFLQFCQFSGNGKTQTGSMFLVCDEGLEDGFLILRRDAAAIVTDCQQHPFVVGEDLQCDPAPFLNGVDGVGE